MKLPRPNDIDRGIRRSVGKCDANQNSESLRQTRNLARQATP